MSYYAYCLYINYLVEEYCCQRASPFIFSPVWSSVRRSNLAVKESSKHNRRRFYAERIQKWNKPCIAWISNIQDTYRQQYFARLSAQNHTDFITQSQTVNLLRNIIHKTTFFTLGDSAFLIIFSMFYLIFFASVVILVI